MLEEITNGANDREIEFGIDRGLHGKEKHKGAGFKLTTDH